MKHIIALFLSMACAVLCNAQTYTISGIVIDSSSQAGIAGALVRLGQAQISTTTGAGGNFTLTNAGVVYRTVNEISALQCPQVLQNNKLFFVATQKDKARIMVYDCNGRVQVSLRENASRGNNIVALPRLADGMYIYRVSLKDRQYTFKSVMGIAANGSPILGKKEGAGATLPKTADQPSGDVLIVTKDGYQLSFRGITNPVTSGIQIKLVAWVTGTVQDIDGNTYRTIKYGAKEWTVENLRTTKNNDGTPITMPATNDAWAACTLNKTGAYCFYNNSTNPDTNKKWGALYNWWAANNGKLAPTGWRVPADSDWSALKDYMMSHGYSFDGNTGADAIGKAMAANTDWVTDSNPVASFSVGKDETMNNSSGFSAFPSGSRTNAGFDGKGQWIFWWSPGDDMGGLAFMHNIQYFQNNLAYYISGSSTGFSMRLVRDVQ